jgi:hypothetical protein
MKPCGVDFRPFPALGCLPARAARLWLEISDDHGQESTYSVTPLTFDPPQAMHKAYTLAQCKGLRIGASYQCTLDHEGGLACTCPGFTHAKHCKHIDALKAAGLLSPSERLETRRLQLECENRMEVIRKGLPKPSRGAKSAHARRLREEAEKAVPFEPTLQPA